MKTSYWLKDSNKKNYPSLKKDITCDILIVGGGISGLSLAYELRNLKQKIVLVEQNELYHASSGYTSGKLSVQHNYIYQKLIKTKGIKQAKNYYLGNLMAIEHIKEIIHQENIDCDFKQCTHSLISKNKNKAFLLEKKAYEKLHIPFVERKINDKYALIMKNQGIFHIVKYLDGLLNCLNKYENITIYEHSKILKTKKKIAFGEHFKIHFKQIIFASLYPPYKSFNFYFLKLRPVLAFTLTAKTQTPLNEAAFDVNKPTFSFRPLPNQQIMFSGCSQNNSDLKSYNEYNKLISLAKEDFKIQDIEVNYNQDLKTLDDIPYIGEIKKDFYLVSGFNKWGLSTSILASLIIKDLINQQKNVYSSLFSPKRAVPFFKLFGYFFKNPYTWVKTKFSGSHKKCSHLYCNLSKNPISNTYDCPCHGSRFDKNGNVLNGPAKKKMK